MWRSRKGAADGGAKEATQPLYALLLDEFALLLEVGHVRLRKHLGGQPERIRLALRWLERGAVRDNPF